MKWLLILWMLDGSELPAGSWGYINIYFDTMEDCRKRGEHEVEKELKFYDYICVPKPPTPRLS